MEQKRSNWFEVVASILLAMIAAAVCYIAWFLTNGRIDTWQ